MRGWRSRNRDKVAVINHRCYMKSHERRKAECRDYHRAHREEILPKMHGRHIRRTFGITTEEYNQMLVAQGGVCLICLRPPKKYRLSVDHKHGTMIVRGLLCARCNRGIGIFWDDSNMLRRAAKYLDETIYIEEVTLK